MIDYKKTCVIANIGSHYRKAIYNKMAEVLDCDFFLGDKLPSPLKTLDYQELKTYKATLHNRFYGKFYWQKGSVKLIRQPYDCYIMDGEPYCLSSWAILLLAKLYGKTTIAWTHGWYGRESRLKCMLKKFFYGLHDKLLVYNEYAINLMSEQGITQNKMYCIANSLDSDKHKQLREQLSSSDVFSRHFHNDHPTVIYCGRIQKSKRLDIIIDALALLKKEGFMVNAVFVGKDIDGVGLENYARQSKVEEQVWMYGPCYDEETLSTLFFNASVCVSPGNVGLTAIHALSFGCPVITHDSLPFQNPEFEAIRSGVTGDFFKQNDTQDLTDKVKYWTTLTDAQRTQVRQEAYNEIDRKWNIHYQINILKQVLHE